MATRTASAEWQGDLPSGKGTFSGESGQVSGEYSFSSRFGDSGGTNPEELVAAAHASCFSMALSLALSEAGNVPDSIKTDAKVQLLKDGDNGFAIKRIDLVTVGRVPGIDDAAFQEAAKGAKAGCPISKALAAVPEINLEARLEN
jgi:osmotically inducible protein OsmC